MEFIIQEPFGAVGHLPLVGAEDVITVEQYVTRFSVLVPFAVRDIIAEIVADITVDDAVLATSSTAVWARSDRSDAIVKLTFRFPPQKLTAQYVGIRYRALLTDGTWKLMDMYRAR